MGGAEAVLTKHCGTEHCCDCACLWRLWCVWLVMRAGRRVGLGEGGGSRRRVMSSRLTAVFESTVVGPGVGVGGMVMTYGCALHCDVVDGCG